MMRRLSRREILALGIAVPFAAVACGDEGPPSATPTSTQPPATPTPVPPTATPAPSPTPVPSLQLLPPQIEQGGVAVVRLNEPASSATAQFEGRQYPMLRHGDSLWSVVGVGALAAVGQRPVSVAFVPPGQARAQNIYASLVVTKKDYPVEQIELSPSVAALLAPEIVNAELARRAEVFAGFTAQRLWAGVFQRPNPGPISSRYGEMRSYNRAPATDYHRGTDFVAETGAPVMAAAAGRVVFTGELRIRGNAVMIDHGAGVFTAYHHLSSIAVETGAMVARLQPVGTIGATGLVTGPHLHWEVIVRGVEVDGEHWLASEFGPA